MAEQRKLIRLGNSSFAISLPKDWIDKSGLKKGDKIFLESNSNGEIIIAPEFKKEEEKRINIQTENKEEDFIKRNFHAAYIKGYDTIVFNGKSKKFIQELLNDYISFEIIESNDKEIIAKDFFDMKEAKFENFVRRIDNSIREMFDVVLEQSDKNKINPTSLKEINEIDKAVNKFYFLCSRIFTKGVDNPTVLNMLKMDGSRLFNHWWVSFHLESLGDGLKYIIRWLTKINPQKNQEIHNVLVRLQQNYIKSMEAFYKENHQKALEVIEETKKLSSEIRELEKDNTKILKIIEALQMIERNIYQNAKMIFYMEY